MYSLFDTTLKWSNGLLSTKQSELLFTSIISGTLTAACIFTYQASMRNHQHSDVGGSTEASPFHTVLNEPLISSTGDFDEDAQATILAERAKTASFDEEIILEQLARNRVFLKESGLSKLRRSFVIVVGCGGVGSHAVAALVRSGVSRVRLIDFDQVTLSSLNRHALATLADVGMPKVHCIRRRLQQIAPWALFDCLIEKFAESSANLQLNDWDGQKPDYIVDAIDNIDSKVELLRYCHSHSIPVISSMGASCKSDPTRVYIGDISMSTDDPLSRSTRRRLRAQGIVTGIPVVFSTEKTSSEKAQLLPLPEDEFAKGKVGELAVLPNFRVRILPVLGTMPAIFGLCIANHIILQITDYPHEYLVQKSRDKMYDGILAHLQGTEERLARWTRLEATGLRVPITQAEVGYIVEEVFRGKSVVSGLTTRLTLIRWQLDIANDPIVNNQTPGQRFSTLKLRDLVCMTKEEAIQHEVQVLQGQKSNTDFYDESVLRMVQLRRQEEHFDKFC